MNTALVSVAIPTYHRPDLLRRLLDTIPQRIPVAISDNGAGTDPSVLGPRPHQTIDAIVPAIPMFANWNRAVRGSGSRFVLNTSDDDLYLPGAFDRIDAAMALHPDADVLVFGHCIIDGEDRVLSEWRHGRSGVQRAPTAFPVFAAGVDARMPSIVFRRELFDRLGGYNESLTLTAGDSELVQRMLLHGHVAWIDEVISCYRVWDGGLTSARQASRLWMAEIDQWAQRVAAEAAPIMANAGIPFDGLAFADRLLAANLLAGFANLRRRKAWGDASALRKVRFPDHAPLRMQAKLRAYHLLSVLHG